MLQFLRNSALGMICFAILFGSAIAQDRGAESRFSGKPAQDIRIGVFATVRRDCKPGPLPTVKLKQPPSNGIVVVKRGRVRATNLKDCLAIEVPGFIAFYRSSPDFIGEDEVQLEVIDASGKTRLHSVRIKVTKNPETPPPAGKQRSPNEQI
jgi:hypothetical protein